MPTVQTRDIVTFIVVTFFFTMEAMLHYAIGKTGRYTLVIPTLKDFIKIVSVVITVALVSTIVTRLIDSYFEE